MEPGKSRCSTQYARALVTVTGGRKVYELR